MPRDPAHCLFFALKPPPAERNRLFNLASGFDGTMQADRLHVTLTITDDFAHRPEALVRAMRNAGDAIAAAPFAVAFDRLGGSATSVAIRPARRQASLAEFQRLLAAAMAAHGVPMRGGWSFNPHVTLAYRAGAPFTRNTPPIGWVAREFVLIHSVVGLTQHNLLGTWALDAVPESDLFGQRPIDGREAA